MDFTSIQCPHCSAPRGRPCVNNRRITLPEVCKDREADVIWKAKYYRNIMVGGVVFLAILAAATAVAYRLLHIA